MCLKVEGKSRYCRRVLNVTITKSCRSLWRTTKNNIVVEFYGVPGSSLSNHWHELTGFSFVPPWARWTGKYDAPFPLLRGNIVRAHKNLLIFLIFFIITRTFDNHHIHQYHSSHPYLCLINRSHPHRSQHPRVFSPLLSKFAALNFPFLFIHNSSRAPSELLLHGKPAIGGQRERLIKLVRLFLL